MIRSEPGIYSWYPSSLCGPYYVWFCELGYPNLDIVEHNTTYQLDDGTFLSAPDGSWSIIEYYNAPVIPSLTRWNFVLSDIRHVAPSPGFIKKYVQQLDLRRKEVWDALDAKEKAQDEEKARVEGHAQDTAERAKNVIMGNPALVERIAKNGLQEINLNKIASNIPRHQFVGHKAPEVPS